MLLKAMLWVRWARCLAMGVDPSNARHPGQIISTRLSDPRGPLQYGVLGSDLFANALDELDAGGSIDLPDNQGGASYGTYVMPCRSFGILDTGDGIQPVRVLPRGLGLHRARRDVLQGSALVDAILHGGTIAAPTLESEAQFFSVNALDELENERDLLQEALLSEYVGNAEVSDRYRRFLATSRWVFERLDGRAMSSAQLIAAAYKDAADGRSVDEVGMAWAEYELRRRVHFALELLLGALTKTLMDLTEGTVDDVLDDWSREEPVPALLSDVLGIEQPVWNVTLADMEEELATDAWIERAVPVSEARDLPSWCKALLGVVVLAASRRQTKAARAAGGIPHRENYLERAFTVLDTEYDSSLRTALRKLLIEVVIEAHLSTTLRKMSQGQQCSLRFFPDGALLRPTGKPVTAGRSGDRLGNVLGMWADLGVLGRQDGGFTLTERGRRVAAEL